MDPKFHWIQACTKDCHAILHQGLGDIKKTARVSLEGYSLQMLHGSGELLHSADLQVNRLDEIQIDWKRVT